MRLIELESTEEQGWSSKTRTFQRITRGEWMNIISKKPLKKTHQYRREFPRKKEVWRRKKRKIQNQKANRLKSHLKWSSGKMQNQMTQWIWPQLVNTSDWDNTQKVSDIFHTYITILSILFFCFYSKNSYLQVLFLVLWTFWSVWFQKASKFWNNYKEKYSSPIWLSVQFN